ncbi:ABC transporter ATP-binding protein [Paractinoplanes hotanensis]|uniref:Betaine/proline/choline family ABC transporter ATP-binding protein n=1 Tax=Paractinoplanes hotanensis TaxID=2906497 RepID=A0ABT0YB09_9ACTN|nr:betaine/proline/choline family ABC transporter ATP-binding protein [Actinoplanes hotanensis]MCM4082713.1 betaine/proline/choline family ABC transporter ATP-binding protein [Actinoplanes hotanensis]
MIRLDKLTKIYRGQSQPAVDQVSMDMPRGEIIVLVGPSGCGKTTTMELINRLIEPTSGRIYLDGEDVTGADPDSLRRRIGYVIQQIGLFPHFTVAENIATVPKLLGWDKRRIGDRVDELLEMLGLEPSSYRGRYPKELSGGQRQRIGVARAMAADPPVMLMDEPFGAIDPITRDRLQNEFLRLQQQVQKTIVFVTHDIDEAIKLGDRIAILGERSQIAQYDTPAAILSNPASPYVADFIGAGASLKRLHLSRVSDVGLDTGGPTARVDADVSQAHERLRASGRGALLLLDADGGPQRWVDAGDLDRAGADLSTAGQPVAAVVEAGATLSVALNEMLTSNAGVAVVVDRSGAFQGLLDFEAVMVAARSGGEFYRAAKVTPDGR